MKSKRPNHLQKQDKMLPQLWVCDLISSRGSSRSQIMQSECKQIVKAVWGGLRGNLGWGKFLILNLEIKNIFALFRAPLQVVLVKCPFRVPVPVFPWLQPHIICSALALCVHPCKPVFSRCHSARPHFDQTETRRDWTVGLRGAAWRRQVVNFVS